MGNFLGGREDPPCDTEDSSNEDLPIGVFMRLRNDNPEIVPPPRPPVVEQVLTTDASRNTGQGLNNSICTFEADKEPPSQGILKQIENELEEYEKISLIYLLFDGRDALCQMEKLLLESESNFLYDWFLVHKETTAKAKFVEAMCVIQNFEVLKRVLDYPSKQDLEARFSPNRKEVATNLNLIKKYIYKLFDNMKNDHYNKFMDLVFHDFRTKGHLFKNFICFEMFFAYFESLDYITTFKLSNLIRHIKAMEMYSDDFDSAHSFFESKTQDEAEGGIDSYSEGMSHLNILYNDDDEEEPPFSNAADRINPWNIPTTSRQSTSAMSLGEHHMKYHINPDSPGTFLLIENKYFFPEPDPQYEKLVIQEQTETRVGTEKDSTRIIKIFQEMGYNCIHEQNVEHYKTIDLIKNVVSDVTEEESTFYICILSHGQRGNVIASNKIAVSVESIKKAMVAPKLEGKPKVFILQACQGDVMQTVPSLPNGLTLDGLGTLPLPIDVLEIRSTVEGFASFRNRDKGTWFIQSLCEMLERYPNEHLVEICQRTNHHVSTKGYPVDAQRIIIKMVCEFRSTLTKDLYLCP